MKILSNIFYCILTLPTELRNFCNKMAFFEVQRVIVKSNKNIIYNLHNKNIIYNLHTFKNKCNVEIK